MDHPLKDIFPDTKFNDNPRIGSKPAMFVRMMDKKGVRKCVKQLKELNPAAPAHIDDGGLIRIYAPDGDLVFSALPKDGETFICRHHREVFSQ